MIINNKYMFLEKLGSGSFGVLYKGENIRTKEKVAIKIEPVNPVYGFSLLKKEASIYHRLHHACDNVCQHAINGIPTVKWFGKDENNYYMVFQLLGESLETRMQRLGIFSLEQTMEIGKNILAILKKVHHYGYIHQDIKPDNFLFDMDGKQIFIIDFGLCKVFKRENMNKKSKSIIGTPCFASIPAHECCNQSKRDDLESLAYMLFYFVLGGNLPWKHQTDLEAIYREKKEFSKYLNSSSNISLSFGPLIHFYQYVLALKTDEENIKYDWFNDS